MYYSSKSNRNKKFGGRAKQFNSRPRGTRKKPNIDINKYVKAAEAPVDAVVYVPTHQFEDFKIDERIKANIRACKYVTPSPIQDQSIEPILEGRDLVGTAQTGTGKTAAFLLPLIDQTIRNKGQNNLIIVPTRELANQINEELRKFANNLQIHSTICIGGANIKRQIDSLKRRPQFVIATPGRLKDLHERHAIKLDTFSVIVLDEVDRMLDMGFVPDIRFIISHLPQRRQSLFFSATLPPEVKNIMQSFLNDPVTVHVDSNNSAKNVDQNIVQLSAAENKTDKLHELLNKEDFSKVLVFSRTKHGADKISRSLYKMGHKVDAIHGDKSQSKREQVLRKFKTDNINVLVATDVAARGIDVKDISHVINYDEPETYQDYIHRIGRTGRGGKTGVALTFVQR
jgi:superfamily II DNA/RNA helicase